MEGPKIYVKPASSLSENDPRLAWPIFTISEAARHLDLPVSTLHNWARPPAEGSAPLVTAFAARGHRATVPFIGFTEAFVLNAAFKAGVPHHRIRPGVEAIKQQVGGLEHALAYKRVFTDGAEILFRFVEEEDLTVARTNQTQFTKTVENQLRLIRYADDGFAARVQLPKYSVAVVTVDPHVASGSPLIESGGARVKDLIDRYQGGDPEADIARDFEVPLNEVKEIVGNA